MRSPVAVQGTMIAFVMPLTFGGNVFGPASTLPGWLQVLRAELIICAVTGLQQRLTSGSKSTSTRSATVCPRC